MGSSVDNVFLESGLIWVMVCEVRNLLKKCINGKWYCKVLKVVMVVRFCVFCVLLV